MWGQEKQEEASAAEQERKETADVAANLTAEDASGIIAFVGKGVEFKGTISYSGTVRIDGYLDGEIHTDGLLLVGEEAVIQAKSRLERSCAKVRLPEISWPKNA